MIKLDDKHFFFFTWDIVSTVGLSFLTSRLKHFYHLSTLVISCNMEYN